jgi:hypothetical protein
MSAQQLEKVSIIPEREQLPAVVTPMAMLAKAVEGGADINVLEKLMGLSERWESNQARKAFDNAMSAAKAEIPVIIKNRVVDFTGKTGLRTNYRHEDLAEIARTVTPILAKHGLSYRYRTTSNLNEPVTVTCIVSHRDGHFEENTLSAGRDESGNKNSIQAVGSTLTYLQRMTLKAALGLAASDDDDGAAADKATGFFISQDQLNQLVKLADEVNADKIKFCKYLRVDSLSQIKDKDFDHAMRLLEAKRGGK